MVATVDQLLQQIETLGLRWGPAISATGISAPDFAELLSNLKAVYQVIWPDSYLDNDAQDLQFAAVVAKGMADCNAGAVAVYNAFSPSTAQSNGLSSVVRINGLTRNSPSSSTADITIVGVAGTVITNGQATDTSGNAWALPASVTIPSGGTITVQATCQTPGAIVAAIGTINKIKTPVYGWQTVNNAVAATPGAPVETDAALRVRQSRSVAGPSNTVFEGIMASVASVPGVTRSRGYENNGNSADSNGVAAHSGAIFVEGGDQSQILSTIARKASPGFGLVGSIAETYIDANGSTRAVRFSRPTNAVVYVALTLKALAGWSTSIQPIIAQAVADYLNTLSVGENVRYFDVSVPAKILNSPYASAFSLSVMTIKKNSGSFVATDLTLAYNEVPYGQVANVTFTIV